jgi:hypothetical protein
MFMKAQLHEARIDAAPGAGMARRHGADHVLLEPADRLALGQRIDGGGIDAGVERPGQGHGARLGRMIVLGHHGRGRQRSHGGLAHRQQVRTRPQHAEEVDHMGNVFIQAKAAMLQGNIACIAPVGDVDVVVAQQVLTVPRSRWRSGPTWAPPPTPWAARPRFPCGNAAGHRRAWR